MAHPDILIARRAAAIATIQRVALRLAALGRIKLPEAPPGQQPDQQHRNVAQLVYASQILEQIEQGIDQAEAEGETQQAAKKPAGARKR